MNLIKRYPVLLSKSQVPEIKQRKTAALALLVEECKANLNITLNPLNLQKQISAKKRRYESSSDESEDEKTCALSTDKLHRLVLIQQLKLIKMQIAQIFVQNAMKSSGN